MVHQTLAIIPARVHSEGIPDKNFRVLAGRSPLYRAIMVALEAHLSVVVSTDAPKPPTNPFGVCWQIRPASLALGTTEMIEVVQYVLAQIPGPDDQMIVLIQPTQPLRTARHITDAITILQRPGVDSVVSVVALPKTHHPFWQYRILTAREGGKLQLWSTRHKSEIAYRQALPTTYIRDGTVYAFYRRTVRAYRGLYGRVSLPLVIQPEDTCPLDTLADWAEAERRLADKRRPSARRGDGGRDGDG